MFESLSDRLQTVFQKLGGKGKLTEDDVRFASAVAAVCVTRWGAQASLPTRAEVDTFMQQHA